MASGLMFYGNDSLLREQPRARRRPTDPEDRMLRRTGGIGTNRGLVDFYDDPFGDLSVAADRGGNVLGATGQDPAGLASAAYGLIQPPERKAASGMMQPAAPQVGMGGRALNQAAPQGLASAYAPQEDSPYIPLGDGGEGDSPYVPAGGGADGGGGLRTIPRTTDTPDWFQTDWRMPEVGRMDVYDEGVTPEMARTGQYQPETMYNMFDKWAYRPEDAQRYGEVAAPAEMERVRERDWNALGLGGQQALLEQRATTQAAADERAARDAEMGLRRDAETRQRKQGEADTDLRGRGLDIQDAERKDALAMAQVDGYGFLLKNALNAAIPMAPEDVAAAAKQYQKALDSLSSGAGLASMGDPAMEPPPGGDPGAGGAGIIGGLASAQGAGRGLVQAGLGMMNAPASGASVNWVASLPPDQQRAYQQLARELGRQPSPQEFRTAWSRLSASRGAGPALDWGQYGRSRMDD